MSEILDQGSLLFATIAVLVVSLGLQQGITLIAMRTLAGAGHPRTPVAAAVPQPGVPPDEDGLPEMPATAWMFMPFYGPLLALATIYVPGTLLIAGLVGRLGGFGRLLSRDYASLLTCTAMAWSAAALPLAAVSFLALGLPLQILIAVAIACGLFFAVLMFYAVRTVMGTDNQASAITVALSCGPLLLVAYGAMPIISSLGWLASPFFLFYAYYYLGGELGSIGSGLRSRQSFRRMLEAAAVNPHDAEAQYQLGLLYQQRRQFSQAIERFEKAVAIDPSETDAHFQLGRIAREQGRLQEALERFQTVINQNEKHASSEILREIGALYLAAKQFEHARTHLAVYAERRPYDTEGLCYYGQTLEQLGETEAARHAFQQSIEAARTAPHFRRHLTAKWSRLSQKHLRRLAA